MARSARRRTEAVVRAGLGAYAVAVPGAWIATQWVHAHLFSLIVPGLIGMAASAAARAAAGHAADGNQILVIGAAAVGAVLSVALSDGLVPGGVSVIDPVGQAGPPYLAALVGVLVLPLLFPTESRL